MIARTTDPNSVDFKAKFDLNGKVIVITGGCGLIGRAFCEAAAQCGAHVVVADIPKSDPEAKAKALEEKHGRAMLGVGIDVGDKSSVETLKEKVLQVFGKIDGLVNGHQTQTHAFFEKIEDYTGMP